MHLGTIFCIGITLCTSAYSCGKSEENEKNLIATLPGMNGKYIDFMGIRGNQLFIQWEGCPVEKFFINISANKKLKRSNICVEWSPDLFNEFSTWQRLFPPRTWEIYNKAKTLKVVCNRTQRNGYYVYGPEVRIYSCPKPTWGSRLNFFWKTTFLIP